MILNNINEFISNIIDYYIIIECIIFIILEI